MVALPWAIVGCGSDAADSKTTSTTQNSNGTTTTTTTTSSTTTSKCVVQDQPTCTNPNSVPSYTNEASQIIIGYCLECHDPNGIGTVSGGTHSISAPPGGYNNPNFTGNGNMMGNPNDPNHIRNNDPNQWDRTGSRDWIDYNNIVRSRGDIITAVRTCIMPAANGTPLPTADQQTLLEWLACGAPDN